MKRITTLVLLAAAIIVTTGCSARQELTREQRVEKLKQQAKTADRERSRAQIEGLREGEREMARERVLENAPASSSP